MQFKGEARASPNHVVGFKTSDLPPPNVVNRSMKIEKYISTTNLLNELCLSLIQQQRSRIYSLIWFLP